MNRRTSAAVAIGVVVAASVGGFVAGSQITSPAEVASRTAAPDPSLILVPVDERVLSSEVVTRGTGLFGSPQKLFVPTSALKPTAGLIAELPRAGREITEGDAVVSASGRPLFLLAGARPMSRDLGPGMSGDDVRQLEDSLSRLGFDPGSIDGVYDKATEAGVEAWYSASGYPPFTATSDQLAVIRARESDLAVSAFDVTAAADVVTSASTALTTAQAMASTAVRRYEATTRAVERTNREVDAARSAAQQDVNAKQAALDRLKSGPRPAATPGQTRAAETDLAAARANEVAVQATGQRAVAVAQIDVDRAPARLDAARSAAAAANQASSADVAAKQATFDELSADPATTGARLSVARSDLFAAQMAAATVFTAGLQAVADAEALLVSGPLVHDQVLAQANAANKLAAADVAAKELVLANLTDPVVATSAEIAVAESDLAIAIGQRDTVRLAGDRSIDEAAAAAADAAADVASGASAASAAAETLTNARSALKSRTDIAALAVGEADLAKRQAGVQVPADEVVFVAFAPVRVAELLAVIGEPAAGSVMTVTDSIVHVDAALAVGDAGLVAVGMTVQLDEPDLGITAEGVVSFVAAAPGTNGVDGFHVYMSVDVAAPPANLVGASVRLTIPVESSRQAVLAVPVSALTLAANGSSRVQRSVAGVTEFVTVIPGLSAAGYVGLTVPNDDLQAGDLVVVGVDRPTAVAGDPVAPPPAETLPPNTVEPASVPAVTSGGPGV